MSHEIFSHDWAASWADELRASGAYREAAATWEGSLVLLMRPEVGSSPMNEISHPAETGDAETMAHE